LRKIRLREHQIAIAGYLLNPDVPIWAHGLLTGAFGSAKHREKMTDLTAPEIALHFINFGIEV